MCLENHVWIYFASGAGTGAGAGAKKTAVLGTGAENGAVLLSLLYRYVVLSASLIDVLNSTANTNVVLSWSTFINIFEKEKETSEHLMYNV
jgi:hypothetical protein